MIIAVVQHRLRGSAAEDGVALLSAAQVAAEAGAELVVFPEVPALGGEDNADQAMLYALLGDIAGQRIIPQLGADATGFAGLAEAPEGLEALGTMALLVGDACVDLDALAQLAAGEPDLAVLIPRAESELQAEAFLELAIALSDSFAGLVLVAEASGGELGEPGHGGSAIISCGKVLAEAVGDEDVLIATVEVPLVQPSPRDPLPQLPTLLAQREATHRGKRPEVDYLADLTDRGVRG